MNKNFMPSEKIEGYENYEGADDMGCEGGACTL